ncbi:MAG: J domain-containing protein [Rickettsiales bacterium]|nr:J domain-containing protein [Rickettsiales bacterium]
MAEVRNFKNKSINDGDDIFSLLNIKTTATEAEVTKAYHKFALIYHTDKFNNYPEHWRIEDQTPESRTKYTQDIFQQVGNKHQAFISNPSLQANISEVARSREESERLSEPIITNLIAPLLKIIAPRLENPDIRIGIGMSRAINLYIDPPLTSNEESQFISLLNSVIGSFETSPTAVIQGRTSDIFTNTSPTCGWDPFLKTRKNQKTKIRISDFKTLQTLCANENIETIRLQFSKIEKLTKIQKAFEFILSQNSDFEFQVSISRDTDRIVIMHDSLGHVFDADKANEFLRSFLPTGKQGQYRELSITISYILDSHEEASRLDDTALLAHIIKANVDSAQRSDLLESPESKYQHFCLIKDDLPKLRHAVFSSNIEQLVSITEKFLTAGVKINEVAPDLLFYAVGSVAVLDDCANNGATMEIIHYLIDRAGIDPDYRVEQSGRGSTDILTEAAKYAKPELLEGLVAKLKPTPERLAKTSFNELNILEHCFRKVKLPWKLDDRLRLGGASDPVFGIQEYEDQWKKLEFLVKQGLVAKKEPLTQRIQSLAEQGFPQPDPKYLADLQHRAEELIVNIKHNEEIKAKTFVDTFVDTFDKTISELKGFYGEKAFGTFIATLEKLNTDFKEVSEFLTKEQVEYSQGELNNLYSTAIPLSLNKKSLSEVSLEKLEDKKLLAEILFQATSTTPDSLVRAKIKDTISNLCNIAALKPLLQMMVINSLQDKNPLTIEAGDFPLKKEADTQVLGYFEVERNLITLDIKEFLQPAEGVKTPLPALVLQGFLAHEMHHAAEYYLYQNRCLPYPERGSASQVHTEIVKEISSFLGKSHGIAIAPTFNSKNSSFLLPACYNIKLYEESHKLLESVVRPSHAIAALVGAGMTEELALSEIGTKFPQSTQYFYQEIEAFKEYNKQAFKKLTRSEATELGAAEAKEIPDIDGVQPRKPAPRNQYKMSGESKAEDKSVIYQIDSDKHELQSKSAIRIDTGDVKARSWSDPITDEKITKQIVANIQTAKATITTTLGDGQLNQFVMHVIKFAQENGGVGNTSPKTWEDYCKDKGDESELYSFKNATQFSSEYQIAARESGIYTGREEGLRLDKDVKDIGARLKRIPEAMNNEIESVLNPALRR